MRSEVAGNNQRRSCFNASSLPYSPFTALPASTLPCSPFTVIVFLLPLSHFLYCLCLPASPFPFPLLSLSSCFPFPISFTVFVFLLPQFHILPLQPFLLPHNTLFLYCHSLAFFHTSVFSLYSSSCFHTLIFFLCQVGIWQCKEGFTSGYI